MGKIAVKEYTCCFTGHRKIAPEQQKAVAERLEKTVEQLILRGYRYFGAGGALGFDTMAASCVMSLKRKYSHIRLILLLPCVDQAKGWRKEDAEVYERIKKQADKIVYISREYTRSCIFQRNRRLVDGSSLCVAYLTEQSGGTAYTVDYARKNGVEVINLAEKE